MTEVKPSTMIHRPYDPNRWRYYAVNSDVYRRTGDLELLNEEEFIKNRKWQGQHENRVFAGLNAAGEHSFYGTWYGLPKLHSKPRIKVGLRSKPIDVYSRGIGINYVSSRAKALLESIDPDAFEFAECDTITRHKQQLEPYWMMAVKRVVAEYDEERSKMLETGGRNPEPVPKGVGLGITTIYEFVPSPNMPRDWHAFYLLKHHMHFIFDQTIVDQWRAQKMTGWTFSPLQPPTPKEAKSLLYATNRDYFFEFGRKKWEHLV